MKRITITITVAIVSLLACKKEGSQKCYWSAIKNGQPIHAWHNNKPSNDEVKRVQDTCFCTITLEEHCYPCSMTVTDPGGNDVSCQ